MIRHLSGLVQLSQPRGVAISFDEFHGGASGVYQFDRLAGGQMIQDDAPTGGRRHSSAIALDQRGRASVHLFVLDCRYLQPSVRCRLRQLRSDCSARGTLHTLSPLRCRLSAR